MPTNSTVAFLTTALAAQRDADDCRAMRRRGCALHRGSARPYWSVLQPESVSRPTRSRFWPRIATTSVRTAAPNCTSVSLSNEGGLP